MGSYLVYSGADEQMWILGNSLSVLEDYFPVSIQTSDYILFFQVQLCFKFGFRSMSLTVLRSSSLEANLVIGLPTWSKQLGLQRCDIVVVVAETSCAFQH